MIKPVLAALISLGGVVAVGWTAKTMYDQKADRTELQAARDEVEVRVASALNEQAYQRYEEKIEEIQQEEIYIRYENDVITPKEREKLDNLKQRREKYEKRQEKLN